MAVKKSTPSNIKLTLKTAHELAKRELGTAKGLTQEESALKDWYYMTVGNLTVRIHPDKQRMYYDDRKLGRWNARDYSAF